MTNEKEELREQLAALEHEQWCAWSCDIANTESITDARLVRWRELWCDYDKLSNEDKDKDREWADKVLSIIDRSARLARAEELLREAKALMLYEAGYPINIPALWRWADLCERFLKERDDEPNT